MRSVFLSAMALCFGLALSACSSSDTPDRAQLRIIHASPDAPLLDIGIGRRNFADNLDYGNASGISTIKPGTYEVQIDAVLPDSLNTVFGPEDLSISNDNIYHVVAINNLASIDQLVISNPKNFDATQARLVLAHLASETSLVDIYLTDVGADLSASTPVATIDFADSETIPLAGNNYRIRVTNAGSTAPIFDTGLEAIPILSGSDLFVGAFDNTRATDSGSDKSPMMLKIFDRVGETPLFNAGDNVTNLGDGADIRMVHASANAPSFDFLVDDTLNTDLGEDIEFEQFSSSYVNFVADNYDIDFAYSSDNAIRAISLDEFTLADGAVYTIVAVNSLANIEPLILEDETRTVTTAAQLRIVHGSILSGNVDIYITEDGEGIEDANPMFTNVSFRQNTGYIQLPAGSYDLVLTPSGSTTIALSADIDNLATGSLYTAIAVDSVGLTEPTGLVLLDAFN